MNTPFFSLAADYVETEGKLNSDYAGDLSYDVNAVVILAAAYSLQPKVRVSIFIYRSLEDSFPSINTTHDIILNLLIA